MKAIVVTDEAAGTAGMTLVERPEPDAALNDVVVQVHASGFTAGELTWPSTWTDRLGRDRTPSIPGHELAGLVSALGYGTTGLSVGQRVFGLADWTRDGTLAEYAAVEARNLAPLPGDVDFTVGASLPISGLTAWQGLFEHGRLQAGQSVPVHGAAGGVGSMVTQLAREAGAYVIAPNAPPTSRPRSTSARRSSSTSTPTPWKTSAASIWSSTSLAARSRSGPRVWFAPEERW
jgi:NADPH:quinone reductase-like Zn-dependent oxidoreductase